SFFDSEPAWVTMPADAWVDGASAPFVALDATQHSLSNPRVTIDGDRATCVVYVQAEHVRADDHYTVGGFYTHTLVRTAAGWRLNQIKLTVRWERGDKSMMTART